MSASDAAPLPRLGEVFFDVRGNSRSMRLSWYADTDVAVFSIWQGGKCTGTFRLPMDDLSRMIEILQRGPEGRSRRAVTARRSGGYDGDNTVVHNPGAQAGGASAGDYGAGQHGVSQDPTGDYGADDHYGPGDYNAEDHAAAEYADYARPRAARHRTERHEPADYGRADFGRPDYGRPEYEQGTEWWQDSDHYQPDRTGQRFVPADDAGYGQQRFVPPYVGSGPDSSEPGFMDDPDYGLPADQIGRSRHSAGRHSGDQGH